MMSVDLGRVGVSLGVSKSEASRFYSSPFFFPFSFSLSLGKKSCTAGYQSSALARSSQEMPFASAQTRTAIQQGGVGVEVSP